MSGKIIFDNGKHQCIMFSDLVKGDGIQSNQFLILHSDEETVGAVIDPGGDLTYTPLTLALLKHTDIKHIRYVIGSHQDPDIIASLPRWLLHTQANIVISRLWERFLPHLNSAFTTDRLQEGYLKRLIALPDEGAVLPLGKTQLFALPAHFLHSEGNFQFYDPISKILFSGDMGASLLDDANVPVEDFDSHIPTMRGFHQRYMVSNKVTRFWADAVRQLDVEMIVPQHGKSFVGKAMINRFLDWIGNLPCGVDLLTQDDYDYAGLINSVKVD
jgi:flavorubredoxin